MHRPRSLGRLGWTHQWLRCLVLAGAVGVMALAACGGPGGASATRELSCDAHPGLASRDWEAGAGALGDSLAAWLAPQVGWGPYPEVLERLRAGVARISERSPAQVEGHAFQRALTAPGRGPDYLTRLGRTLQEEVRARRLTLRDVRSGGSGIEGERAIVNLALHGLPDSLLVVAGAETILCHELHLLLPVFEPGYATDLSDLGEDPGPFVGTMSIVHRAGPVGRGITARIIRAADPFPGLAGFVRRVARGLDSTRVPESPL